MRSSKLTVNMYLSGEQATGFKKLLENEMAKTKRRSSSVPQVVTPLQRTWDATLSFKAEAIELLGNLEMKAVLGWIASTSEELAHFHSGDEDGIYLAYSDFRPYLLADSSWSLPNLARADSQKSQHQRVSELQRLRSIFGTNERQWVEAQVENAKQQHLKCSAVAEHRGDNMLLSRSSISQKDAKLISINLDQSRMKWPISWIQNSKQTRR
ncbi:hypothetical protein L1987_07967 [Smallanthus sonchifolius]|uniref:Uncharacterized protein n=1 Tax=Smallanthus sonchifolius TaxID=185202 RepID=A0ACB9JKX9_9ASTR|nr:hypothetical protein L1987_07967 [Smallanthus sonchifolius]